jgi:hypothetical protein
MSIQASKSALFIQVGKLELWSEVGTSKGYGWDVQRRKSGKSLELWCGRLYVTLGW